MLQQSHMNIVHIFSSHESISMCIWLDTYLFRLKLYIYHVYLKVLFEEYASENTIENHTFYIEHFLGI